MHGNRSGLDISADCLEGAHVVVPAAKTAERVKLHSQAAVV
jgi:hypothetical protein